MSQPTSNVFDMMIFCPHLEVEEMGDKITVEEIQAFLSGI